MFMEKNFYEHQIDSIRVNIQFDAWWRKGMKKNRRENKSKCQSSVWIESRKRTNSSNVKKRESTICFCKCLLHSTWSIGIAGSCHISSSQQPNKQQQVMIERTETLLGNYLQTLPISLFASQIIESKAIITLQNFHKSDGVMLTELNVERASQSIK